MAQTGGRDNEDPDAQQDNPLRDLADILENRAARHVRPRPETDRRTNYREPPPPPGLDLTATAIEDAVRRDAAMVEHVHEVSRVTAGSAAERRTVRIDAGTGHEILDYLDAHRATLPAELRERIDATADRLLRLAYAASTRTRLVCPYCGGETVVPTPDLKTLLCLDYECAPAQPRRVDPTYAQEPERRITAKQLALLAGEEDAAMRKKLSRAKIKPIYKGPHNRFEYRWADVAHLVGPKLPSAPPPSAPNANRESRSGGIVSARAA